MKKQQLSVKQMDEKLAVWREARHFFQPSMGWVRTLRQVLGMTSAQLASRLGINRSRIIAIEHAEIEGVLKLKTLKHVADALNCDLIYAFVPRKSLNRILEDQASTVAKKQMEQIVHTMGLEDQATSQIEAQRMMEEQVSRLLNGPLKYLWQEV